MNPVQEPTRVHEIVSQIIRAFILRINISGKDIKPVPRFDEELLQRPLDDLMRAVIKFEEMVSLAEEVPEIMDSITSYKEDQPC